MRVLATDLVYLDPWAEDFVDALGEPVQYRRINEPFVHFERITGDPLKVIISGRVEDDGRRWIHVSCSHRNRLPSWQTLREVKDTFIGKERKAIQVLPPQSEYVNLHNYGLHLWCCLDGDGLPDFRIDGLV